MNEMTAGYDAIHVHVDNATDFVVRTEEHEPEHFTFATFVLQPGQAGGSVGTGGQAGFQQLLAQDPLRKDASILPIDAPIVLCDSAMQAMQASNQVAGFPAPAGAYVPQGTSVSLEGTGPAYGACQVATRVSIIINRRGA
jgi:hypothetical protein